MTSFMDVHLSIKHDLKFGKNQSEHLSPHIPTIQRLSFKRLGFDQQLLIQFFLLFYSALYTDRQID